MGFAPRTVRRHKFNPHLPDRISERPPEFSENPVNTGLGAGFCGVRNGSKRVSNAGQSLPNLPPDQAPSGRLRPRQPPLAGPGSASELDWHEGCLAPQPNAPSSGYSPGATAKRFYLAPKTPPGDAAFFERQSSRAKGPSPSALRPIRFYPRSHRPRCGEWGVCWRFRAPVGAPLGSAPPPYLMALP